MICPTRKQVEQWPVQHLMRCSRSQAWSQPTVCVSGHTKLYQTLPKLGKIRWLAAIREGNVQQGCRPGPNSHCKGHESEDYDHNDDRQRRWKVQCKGTAADQLKPIGQSPHQLLKTPHNRYHVPSKIKGLIPNDYSFFGVISGIMTYGKHSIG